MFFSPFIIMKDPEITRSSLFDMQVCVPEHFTDKQVVAFAQGQNPCGTSGGWQIRREGDKALDGDPERVSCEAGHRKGCVHIMLDA